MNLPNKRDYGSYSNVSQHQSHLVEYSYDLYTDSTNVILFPETTTLEWLCRTSILKGLLGDIITLGIFLIKT